MKRSTQEEKRLERIKRLRELSEDKHLGRRLDLIMQAENAMQTFLFQQLNGYSTKKDDIKDLQSYQHLVDGLNSNNQFVRQSFVKGKSLYDEVINKNKEVFANTEEELGNKLVQIIKNMYDSKIIDSPVKKPEFSAAELSSLLKQVVEADSQQKAGIFKDNNNTSALMTIVEIFSKNHPDKVAQFLSDNQHVLNEDLKHWIPTNTTLSR